jgi:hypothetical protein
MMSEEFYYTRYTFENILVDFLIHVTINMVIVTAYYRLELTISTVYCTIICVE